MEAIDADGDPVVEGGAVRFMWDYGADVPLWDLGGLMPSDPDWLRGELGLGHRLTTDLLSFAADLNRHDSRDRPLSGRELRSRENDLYERLSDELAGRYEVHLIRW